MEKEDGGGQKLYNEGSDNDAGVMVGAEIEANLEEGVSHGPPANVSDAATKKNHKDAVLADEGGEGYEAPSVAEKVILVGKKLVTK